MQHQLDVSHLEPCEPLERTLAIVRLLGQGDSLRVIHRREPRLLFPLLEQSGFHWRCRQTEPGIYEIYIWRDQDAKAETEVMRQLNT